MDAKLRELRREAAAGDTAARRRLRRALERAGQSGGFEGLVVGDTVELRSCLPGPERVWRGVVRGSTPDDVPVVIAEVTLDGETQEADVTGCPSCSVELLDEDARPAKKAKPKRDAAAQAEEAGLERQLRAEELTRNGDHEGAVRLLRKETKRVPGYAYSWELLASNLLALYRAKPALESAQRGLALQRTCNGRNLLRLQGEALACLGRHAEAIESLEAALAMTVYGKAHFVQLIRASRKALASSSKGKRASVTRRAKR